MSGPRGRRIGGLSLALAVLLGLGVGIYLWSRPGPIALVLPTESCLAVVGDQTTEVDLEQAQFAALIAGVARQRGLPPRAASIALATAYQESGIRNLDYGDRDSLGLFQQRPSAGWGTKKQIMDPYYSTGKFYAALVKVQGWETGNLNDVAQKVQRSGFPDAYAQHVPEARALGSALTGQTPAAFSCLEREQSAGDPTAFAAGLQRTFGDLEVAVGDQTVTVRVTNPDLAWAYGSYAVALASVHGVTSVRVGDRQWDTGTGRTRPVWVKADPGSDPGVVIAFRA